MMLMNPNIEAASITSAPEFVDAKGLKALYGLSRSHAYVLADQGSIRSICIRRPGAVRGKRLFCCQSIREFLARCEDQGRK
jgi:hypothetical protein